MSKHRRTFAFARLLSSAVVSQAILSAGNFFVGLVLIRTTSTDQYGYYVLALSAIILLVSLQNAFFNPPLALRLTALTNDERAKLVGDLYQLQTQWLLGFGVIALLLAIGLSFSGIIEKQLALLIFIAIATAIAILHREFFRMVLFAYRHAAIVLGTDIVYVLLVLIGVLVATFGRAAATIAIAGLGLAAVISGVLLLHHLWRFAPWNPRRLTKLFRETKILREIAPLASWSTAGAATHWTFSQGYIYLVAATLDVGAVAAIAATRLLLMPVNLLSTGIGSLMLPLASNWLHYHGMSLLWRRLCLFAAGLTVITLGYFSVLWWFRDWIFTELLKLDIAQADILLLLWGAIFLVIVIRDQLGYLLAAQGRFRLLTFFTLFCALLSLAVSYFAMLRFGMVGALLGILLGEVISLVGVIIFSQQQPNASQPPLENNRGVHCLSHANPGASSS